MEGLLADKSPGQTMESNATWHEFSPTHHILYIQNTKQSYLHQEPQNRSFLSSQHVGKEGKESRVSLHFHETIPFSKLGHYHPQASTVQHLCVLFSVTVRKAFFFSALLMLFPTQSQQQADRTMHTRTGSTDHFEEISGFCH